MENRHIRVFLTLYDGRTLSAAARRLNVDESSVSRTIRDLEQLLNVTLFDRTSRGMSPTVFGESFARHARAMRAELNRALEELIDLGGRSGGTTSIGTTPSFATALVPRACARVFTRLPQANIKVFDGLQDDLVPRLITGELDLVVSTLVPFQVLDPMLTFRPFKRRDVATIVMRREHPLASADKIRVQDLETQSWILPKRTDYFREAINRIFLQLRLHAPRPQLEFGSFLLLKSVIVEYNYLSFLPLSIVHQEIMNGSVKAIDIGSFTIERTGGVIGRKNSSLSAVAKNLEREIIQLGNDPTFMIEKSQLRTELTLR